MIFDCDGLYLIPQKLPVPYKEVDVKKAMESLKQITKNSDTKVIVIDSLTGLDKELKIEKS